MDTMENRKNLSVRRIEFWSSSLWSVHLARTQTLSNFRFMEFKQKKKSNCNFDKRTEFWLSTKRARWDEGGGRILVGDDTGDGTVTTRPVKFWCVRLRCLGK